ncbi:MAG: ABC transporter ATP-binding protein [Actinobacteria bacterium]|nr:ABC transporter ATP-binding protein [Actinomycetota bacterium]
MNGIDLRQVTRSYQLGGESFDALHQVDLHIDKGSFVAITGPSGSGKSTLANIIGGLDRPTSGSVNVDGNDLAKLNDSDLSNFRNRTIGFIFQSFNLKADSTAVENVALPLIFAGIAPKLRKARALECLDRVGLGDRANHLPNQLSGGQRQRVAIARALANHPSVILADEPTGNLDSARGKEVIEILSELNRDGITLLVITHDLDVASHAQRIIEVHDGAVREGRVAS